MDKLTTKQRGDAGEYYALSQFIFNGLPAAKMPDNWPNYDLAVEIERKLVRVSIKTRVKPNGDFGTEHCKFSGVDEFDFIAFIFKSEEGIECWVLPKKLAENVGKTERSSDENYRRISYKQLATLPMKYKNNWLLEE